MLTITDQIMLFLISYNSIHYYYNYSTYYYKHPTTKHKFTIKSITNVTIYSNNSITAISSVANRLCHLLFAGLR